MSYQASRAYHWAAELQSLQFNELHSRVSDIMNSYFNEGDTYCAFRTMSTFLLECKLNIKITHLLNYERFMTELDNVIENQKHSTCMFVPYDRPENL